MPVDVCPPQSMLDQLLADYLPPSERDHVSAHIEHCGACQSRLDSLVADDSMASWTKLAQVRSGPRVDENFLATMRCLVPPLSQSSSRIAAVETTRSEQYGEAICPETIGEYEILGEIGRGGMAIVYKARQPKLGRIVALKRLRLRDQDEADVARCLREAETLAGVPHPNIVQIFAVGDDAGRPFLALEYVAGGSLADHLRGAPVEPRAAATFLRKVAQAIHHAHQHRVIHRDLKPANVLLATTAPANLATCEPKVADFGLARRVDDDPGLTQPDMLAGTPAYLAPEQIGQQTIALAPACDIYALGVMLYEMLTGRPPLLGPTVLATLRLVESTDPVPPRRLQPQVPRDLETICLKCLRKDPQRRYASAEAVAEDLGRFLDHRTIRARRAGVFETGFNWSRRNPVLAGLAVALLISLGVGIAFSMAFLEETRRNEIVARELAVQSTINSRLANDRAYVSDLRLASSMWSNRQLDLLVDLLDSQRPKRTDGIERRGFEWHYLWRASHPPHSMLTKLSTPARSVAFGRDPHLIAIAAGDSIRFWNIKSGKESLPELHVPSRQFLALAWSQNGHLIAATLDNGSVVVWDSETRKAVGNPLMHRQVVLGLDFDPTGELLATACRDGKLRIWDWKTDAVRQTLDGDESGLNAVAYSRDGKMLAAGGRNGAVQLWETETWREKPQLAGHVDAITCLAFNPDGSLLASGSLDQSLRLWQPETGRTLRSITHHFDAVTDVAFSRDGQWLASASLDRTLRVIDVATNLPLPPLLGHAGTIASIAFTPDSTRLASASSDKSVRLWDLADETSDRRLTGNGQPVQAAATDPLGHFFATATKDGEIRLWDAVTNLNTHTLKGPKEGVSGLAVNPDGTILAAAGADRKIHFWDPHTGKPLRSLTGHHDRVECVAFSADGTKLASGGGDQWLRIWNPATGELLASLENARKIKCITWHPARPLVAAGCSDGFITVYDTATGLAIQRLAAHKADLNALAFSPDGTRLASAGADRAIILWDAETWSKRETLRGHIAGVTAVQFGPDSRRLFSASLDATVRIWNVADGQPLLMLSEPTPMQALVVSSNGMTLIAAGKSGLIRLWKAVPDAP